MARKRSQVAQSPLRVTNQSRGGTIIGAGRVADSFASRLRGLIGSRPPGPGEGLLIAPCKSVHTLMMSFPIDIVYVNASQVVQGIDHALAPWRMGRFYRDVRYVLELPAGTAEASGTQVGDQLQVQGYTL